MTSLDALNLKKCINIFSYGSNSLAQLRGRITIPPQLEMNYPARLHNYERIFAGVSSWQGGGAASLQRLDGASTYGSIVKLTIPQLEQLTMYEGGYDLHVIQCETLSLSDISQIDESIEAYTFIKQNHYYVNPPSEAYLTAIHHHLSELKLPTSIPIIGYTSSQERVVHHEGWQYPNSVLSLSVQALIVTLNILRIQRGELPWVMPKTANDISKVLQNLGVNSVKELAVAFQKQLPSIIEAVNAIRFEPLDKVTLDILLNLFLNAN